MEVQTKTLSGRAFKWMAGLVGLVMLVGLQAVQAQELTPYEKIKKDGVLKVAVYNNLFPFSDNGKGIDVDLAKALATELGLSMQLLPFDADETFSDDLRNMVWRGSLLGYGPGDVFMHSPIDDYLIKNEEKVLFFAPYTREEVFVARNLKKIPSLDTLEPFSTGEFKIGCEVASLSSEVLAGADSGSYVDNLTNYKTVKLAMEGLVKGEVDAVMGTRSELEAGLHNVKNREDFYVSRVRHNSLPPKGWAVGMAVKKSNPELAKALTDAMEKLKASGKVAEIFESYGVKYQRP